MITPPVSAHGITVRYTTRTVLDDVSVDLRAGEVLALAGPNGAGKSTLLSVLSGDVRPQHGTVHYFGHDLHALRVQRLAQIRAVQLQESRSAFAFTAQQIVMMGRAPWPAGDDERIVSTAIDAVELNGFESRGFPSLSGGEKARASFARVLAQETPVMFLDEPTAALDIRHQEALLSRVRQRSREGASVVVVLHDLTLAAAYADRLIVLDGGRVAIQGPPREALRAEALSEVYRFPIDVVDTPGRGLIVLPRRESGILL